MCIFAQRCEPSAAYLLKPVLPVHVTTPGVVCPSPSAPAQVEERSVYLVVGEQLALLCPQFDASSGPVESTEWSIDAKGARKLQKGKRNHLKTIRIKCAVIGEKF